jgi:hypothetical protein
VSGTFLARNVPLTALSWVVRAACCGEIRHRAVQPVILAA